MLFIVDGYFYWLAALVAAYWLLHDSHPARFLLMALAGSGSVAFLLYWNLPTRLAVALMVCMLAVTAATYGFARGQIKARSRTRLRIALAVPFAMYGVAHGSGLFVAAPSGLALVIPISIGFFVLRQLHGVYECYRGNIVRMDWQSWAAYVFFLPTVIAGPLARYPQFSRQVATPFSWVHFSRAGELMLIGAFKKFIVADLLISAALPPATLVQAGFAGVTWAVLAAACFAKLLFVYFDFAGYTDMARGTARLFGIDLPENFNRPLLCSNLAEFWRSWHMSLSSFARDYVFFPVLAVSRKPALAIVASMLVIAAWHGLQTGWLIWGLHHAFGLVALAAFQRRSGRLALLQNVRASLSWRIGASGFTLLFVAAGYAWTWLPDQPLQGFSIYLRLWTFGVLG